MVSKYSVFMACRHGHLEGSDLSAVAASYQLPLDMNTADNSISLLDQATIEKDRSLHQRNSCAATIYAESLKNALASKL